MAAAATAAASLVSACSSCSSSSSSSSSLGIRGSELPSSQSQAVSCSAFRSRSNDHRQQRHGVMSAGERRRGGERRDYSFLTRTGGKRIGQGVVAMAPDEEKMTRRSPLDFPVEWDRPSPGRRPDIFPQFSPMKTPLPPPLPADPPEEDEEEEEKKEEDPEKEDKPEE